MKITYCVPQLYIPGGVERIITEKANWLVNNGYEVTIITTDQKNKPFFYKLDKRVIHEDLGINYNDNLKGNLLLKKIRQYIKYKIHKKKLEEYLIKNPTDITLTIPVTCFRFLHKIKDKSKKILEFHMSLKAYDYNNGLLSRFFNYRMKFFQRKAINNYDILVALTNEDRLNRGEYKNLINIPNFIPNYRFETSESHENVVIAVGRLSEQKSFDRLLFIWEEVNKVKPDWVLKIFGEGEQKDYLLDIIRKKQLSNSVQICSPTKNIFKEYSNSSIFVSTSIYEGLPMVLIEALKCGLPIISFDYPCGPKDIIDNGENGFIVNNNDLVNFRNKLILLMNNKDLRNQMSQKSLKKSILYSQDKVMSQWDKLFKSMIYNK